MTPQKVKCLGHELVMIKLIVCVCFKLCIMKLLEEDSFVLPALISIFEQCIRINQAVVTVDSKINNGFQRLFSYSPHIPRQVSVYGQSVCVEKRGADTDATLLLLQLFKDIVKWHEASRVLVIAIQFPGRKNKHVEILMESFYGYA